MSDVPNLKTVTFTGADDTTDISALVKFQQEFPQSEIGVLVAPDKTGQPGYPREDWINAFCQAASGHRALHLCEDAIWTFLGFDSYCWKLAEQFGRVQLNIFQGKRPVHPHQVNAAARTFHENTGGRVIVPMNPKNETMVLALEEPSIQVLFDGSGGTGTLARTWSSKLPNRECSWAGGLGPCNVAEQVPLIDQAAQGQKYGIDMETGVKGQDGHFDIGLCREVMFNLGY